MWVSVQDNVCHPHIISKDVSAGTGAQAQTMPRLNIGKLEHWQGQTLAGANTYQCE
jgi:hypothetical protein